MSKHTPGPWTAIPDDTGDEREWYVVTEEEDVVAFSVSEEADAALIATAPDLLAACKHLTEAAHDPTSLKLGSEDLQRFISAWGEIRAAIAKAEGGS